MTEDEARRVLLLQATEAAAEGPLWTAEDRAWATALARQTVGAEAPAERFVAERARHAMERLAPRDAAARRWLARSGPGRGTLLAAVAVAFGVGALVDQIGAPQRVNLLAPPVWAVIAWNLVVYAALLLPRPAAGLRQWLARRWLAGHDGVALLWARHAAPLSMARVAAVLHLAAAALALGVAGGLYVRGLVLDYRAGWQSTFLEAPTVQALLGAGLAPAAAVTGIAVPDVAPLRVAPEAAATASAAPWIHLYAAMLALFVVLPRVVLAGWAGWRAARLARQFPLPLDEPYFQRLRLQQQGGVAQVQVLPHGAAPGAQAALGLQAVLAAVFGAGVQLRMAAATPFGDEDRAPAAEPGTTLRIALFDLAATPEEEAQGRFIAALAGGPPLAVVADESAFRRRFAGVPERLAQRRAVWQQLAAAHGAVLLCTDLEAPDLAAARAVLEVAFVR